MSSKLVKKLKKDLKKSPGKAAVLASLLGVAVWFWAPLLTNMLGGSKAPANTATNTTNNSEFPVVAGNSPQTQTTPQYTWKQIAEAVEHDPRMKPAIEQVLTRDPFLRVIEKKKTEPEGQTAPPLPVAIDVPPAEVGLTLTSTIVGPSRRVARLQGKTYREGDTITVNWNEKSLNYKVMSVDVRSILLALGDKEYELKMTKPRVIDVPAEMTSVSSDSPDFDPSILEQ